MKEYLTGDDTDLVEAHIVAEEDNFRQGKEMGMKKAQSWERLDSADTDQLAHSCS